MQSLAIVKYPYPYAVVNDTYEMANDTKRLPGRTVQGLCTDSLKEVN